MYFCALPSGSGCADWQLLFELSLSDVDLLLSASVFALVVAFGLRIIRRFFF